MEKNEWIEWRGGECPVHRDTIIDFKTINKVVSCVKAGERYWGEGTGMVAYRLSNASALDVQEGGDHYKNMAIQPIEYIHANGLGFAAGSVVKYVSRYQAKNGLEDLKKARHFIDLMIELESKKEGE